MTEAEAGFESLAASCRLSEKTTACRFGRSERTPVVRTWLTFSKPVRIDRTGVRMRRGSLRLRCSLPACRSSQSSPHEGHWVGAAGRLSALSRVLPLFDWGTLTWKDQPVWLLWFRSMPVRGSYLLRLNSKLALSTPCRMWSPRRVCR